VAPAECPGRDDVQARVHRLLGPHAPNASRQERLVAEGTVVAVSGRYRLSLIVRQGNDPSGTTRVFDSTSCDSLAGAAAVTLALLARGANRTDGAAAGGSTGPPTSAQPTSAAQPAATATGSTPAGSPPAATATGSTPAGSPPAATATGSTPAGSPSAAPAPLAAPANIRASSESAESHPETTPEAPSTRGWSPALEAPFLAVDAGVLPWLVFGMGVGVGVRVNRLRVRLAGLLWLPQSGGGAAPYEATYERRTGELSGCYSWSGGSFEVGPCLTVSLEDVTSSGSGPDVAGASGHVRWLTMGLAARAGWSLRRWAALFVRPGLTFTTSRPTFTINGVGPLYQVPFAAGGAEVGCEWIF
jgi:hypothetical protein